MILRAALLLALLPGPAAAHAGAQSFVLLLPTGLYIAGGLAAVVLTVALITILPGDSARQLFTPLRFRPVPDDERPSGPVRTVITFAAFIAFAALLYAGANGSNDPTRNPLTIALWTFLWLHLLLIAGIVGNPWPWLSPWAFPLALARRLGLRQRALPVAWGHWPALPSLAALAGLLLIHPEAADPDTLTRLAALYFAAHLAAALVFGQDWLDRAEAFTVIFAAFASLAPVTGHAAGTPGWQAISRPPPDAGLALFMIALLAIGSFDGLYKTFFWLDLIGVNPLEFEGRTTVIWPNTLGLAASVPLLAVAYGLCLWAGLAMVGHGAVSRKAFRAFAPTLLPIAFAYHFAHFLPAILVESQAIPAALNDPLGTGAALLGLDDPRVTTGFLMRLDTVRVIWLTQAGAVVFGHMIAILMAHRVALSLTGGHRAAAISQFPLAAFMVGYTLFGLWLLASPQGA